MCDQECENFDGGYRCKCFKGYTQDLQTKKCVCRCLNNVYFNSYFWSPYILFEIPNPLFKFDEAPVKKF